MSTSWRMAMACCGALLVSTSALAQAGPPADASLHNQLITACMAQQDPALKKEDAQQICRQKLKQGIKVKKKKQKPASAPTNEQVPAQK